MILVELYSKADCRLCEEAKSVLERVRRDIPFTLHEVKLAPGEEYYEEYKDEVPVIHIDKRFAFQHRVNEHLFRLELSKLMGHRPTQTEEDAVE